MDICVTLTTMLQEVQGLMNLRRDKVIRPLYAYDGNGSAHLRYPSYTGLQLSFS